MKEEVNGEFPVIVGVRRRRRRSNARSAFSRRRLHTEAHGRLSPRRDADGSGKRYGRAAARPYQPSFTDLCGMHRLRGPGTGRKGLFAAGGHAAQGVCGEGVPREFLEERSEGGGLREGFQK